MLTVYRNRCELHTKNIHSTIEHRFSTVNIKQTKQKIYTISNIQQQHKASGTEKYTMQDENKTNKQPMMFTAVEVKGDCYWLTEETNVSETKMGNTLHQ